MIISTKLKKFIIKYSLISSLFVWALGYHFKDFTQCIIDTIVHPLMSIDLDQNGEPDLLQFKRLKITINNVQFPIGKLIIGTIDFIVKILLIMLFVWLILNYSTLIKV